MSDPAESTADRPARKPPFQFGMRHLFLLTFLVAVFLGTLVGLYPFSVILLYPDSGAMLPTDLPPETLRALLVTDDDQPVDAWDRIRK
jgi:hypothetical protein